MFRIPRSLRINAPDPLPTPSKTTMPSPNSSLQIPSPSTPLPNLTLTPSPSQSKRPPARKAFKRRMRSISTNEQVPTTPKPQPRTPKSNISKSTSTRPAALSKNLRWTAITLMHAMEAHRRSTCSEVTEMVAKAAVADAPTTTTSTDKETVERNTRRRIYDALQVMTSIGCVQRDDKNLLWIGVDHLKDPSPTTRSPAPRSRRKRNLNPLGSASGSASCSGSHSNSSSGEGSENANNACTQDSTVSSQANEMREMRIELCKARKRVAHKQDVKRAMQGLVEALQNSSPDVGKRKGEVNGKVDAMTAATIAAAAQANTGMSSQIAKKKKIRHPFLVIAAQGDKKVEFGKGREILRVTTCKPAPVFAELGCADTLVEGKTSAVKKGRRGRVSKTMNNGIQGIRENAKEMTGAVGKRVRGGQKKRKVNGKETQEELCENSVDNEVSGKRVPKPAKRARGRPRSNLSAVDDSEDMAHYDRALKIENEEITNMTAKAEPELAPAVEEDVDDGQIEQETLEEVPKIAKQEAVEEDIRLLHEHEVMRLERSQQNSSCDELRIQSPILPEMIIGDEDREQVETKKEIELEDEKEKEEEVNREVLEPNFAIDDSNEMFRNLNLTEPLISASQLGLPPLPDVEVTVTDENHEDFFNACHATWPNSQGYDSVFQNWGGRS